MKSANPSKHAIPLKSYFRIGEVASIVGVEPHVLRYWEREFRGVRPTKSEKGQRVYSRKDVEKLSRVRELLYEEGFTIAGAKKKLSGDIEPKDEAALLSSGAAAATNAVSPNANTVVAAHAEAATMLASERALSIESENEASAYRETLTELRTEIAAFLDHLEGE